MHIKAGFFVLLLLGLSNAWAGSISYEFETVLELESGPDTTNLDGALVRFTAEIAEGTTYQLDPIYNLYPSYVFDSYAWSIAGGSTVDGIYTGTESATWTFVIVGVDYDEFFDINPFNDLRIIHTGGSASIGSFVSATDFEPLLPTPSPTTSSLVTWSTLDGSSYNWSSNASYSATEVPLPSTLLLFITAIMAVQLAARGRFDMNSLFGMRHYRPHSDSRVKC